MLSDVVEKNSHVNGFIFDGFPRTESQAHALDSLLEDFNTSISGQLSYY
jgi:adenylate kinase